MLSFLLLWGLSVPGWAQVNISGKSGLMYIPTATATEDGALRLGVAYNPIDYGLRRRGRNAERIVYANLTILKRLEINMNFLQLISTDQFPVREALGDRQLDVRYLLLTETKKRPSVAIVMSSPFTIDAAMLTHVIVATKSLKLQPDWDLKVTAGLGSPYFFYRNVGNLTSASIFEGFKWQKKSEYRYNNHYLVGPFGGVQLAFRDKVGVMAEFDSKFVNIGLYGTLFKRWNVQAGLINFDQVTLGTSWQFSLLNPSKRLKKLYEQDK
ncbi:YjbH domain-containing protein [Arundinibacter roseus]|uniref:YjbH domain-containing protein n=1 Tax=Arundinibacter roseus TaxID=2070510 RepID=UPI001E3A13DB|nr:YjbH domain-containing protein [Arundinibacter roseus]